MNRLPIAEPISSRSVSQRAVITHHIYWERRTILVRASGQASASEWNRSFEQLRHGAAFGSELNVVVIAMEPSALIASALPALLTELDALVGRAVTPSRCGIVAANADTLLNVERTIANARVRHFLIRCFLTETAALDWIGWDAALALSAKPVGT
jgi:hypothetical protein